MDTLPALKAWVLLPSMVFLLCLAALTTFRLLTGKIRTRGLLLDARSGRVSALKVQMLLSTLAAAATYVADLATNTNPHSLPPMDHQMLAFLGGSHGLLIGGRSLEQLVRLLKR